MYDFFACSVYIDVDKNYISETNKNKLINLCTPITYFIINTRYQSTSQRVMSKSSYTQVTQAIISSLDSVYLDEFI